MNDTGPCAAVTSMSTIGPVPVDIIIAIDNSGSMVEEAAEVQRNINRFASIIAASGLDYHVVLISQETGDTGVCVPPPLGSGTPRCVSGPGGRLRHVHRFVGSFTALNHTLSAYPEYSDFLRPAAAKVFIWITDDESERYTADSFRAALAGLAPARSFTTQIHNAIVGYYGDTPRTWTRSASGSCDSLANVGVTYLRLASCLNNAGAPIAGCRPGMTARVCESDWSPIFEEIARGVVAGVPVACEFNLPTPPVGQTYNVDMAMVETRTTGGAPGPTVRRVENLAACTADGWYFDNNTTPTKILLCPALCRTERMDANAEIRMSLGCWMDIL